MSFYQKNIIKLPFVFIPVPSIQSLIWFMKWSAYINNTTRSFAVPTIFLYLQAL